MKNHKQNHRKQKQGWTQYLGILAILALLFAVPIIMLCVQNSRLNRVGNDADNIADKDIPSVESEMTGSLISDAKDESKPVVPDDPIVFPILLENGKLEIERVFLYDGMNPDCGNIQGSNITALEVRNLSAEQLEKAIITLDSDEGKTTEFTIAELPAKKSVIVFSYENVSSSADTVYGNVRCEALFNADASIHSEKISISTDGTRITLRNNTDTQMNDIVVYCRSVLDDRYFGGIAYSYTIKSLSAHETTELDVVDCILGFAEAVRVEINNS